MVQLDVHGDHDPSQSTGTGVGGGVGGSVEVGKAVGVVVGMAVGAIVGVSVGVCVGTASVGEDVGKGQAPWPAGQATVAFPSIGHAPSPTSAVKILCSCVQSAEQSVYVSTQFG